MKHTTEKHPFTDSDGHPPVNLYLPEKWHRCMKTPFKGRISDTGVAAGFTLIEVIVGLMLFVVVALPLIAGLYRSTGSLQSQESLIATWLLEQESASVRLFPEAGLSTRRRVIDGKLWMVQIRPEGSPLVRYTLTALKNGKEKGKVVVYGIDNK